MLTVDGGWAYWGEFGECSASCGGGEKTRERSCTHPAPSNGGAECKGDSKESMSCNEEPCPGKYTGIKIIKRPGFHEETISSLHMEEIYSN